MTSIAQREIDIFLAFQDGCLGYIFPSLRLVRAEWTKQTVDLCFYHDGEISDDDVESINLIDTYFGANFSNKELEVCNIDIIRKDFPKSIEFFSGKCLYAREEIPFVGKTNLGVMTERMDRVKKIRFASQRAMINHIFPSLRGIIIQFNNISSEILFYIDGEISDTRLKSLDIMRMFFSLQFPSEEMQECSMKAIRLDFPARMTETNGILVYKRKEGSDL